MQRLILIGCLALAQLGADTPLPQRITSRRYGFSLQRPPGWRVALDKDGLPLLSNVEWSKLQPQGILPIGEATINLVSWNNLTGRPGDNSLAGWADLDAVIAASGTVSKQIFPTSANTRISEALIDSFDQATYSPNEQPQREVSVYWRFEAKMFAAHLNYAAGDPKGADYENTLKDLIRSIRPAA